MLQATHENISINDYNVLIVIGTLMAITIFCISTQMRYFLIQFNYYIFLLFLVKFSSSMSVLYPLRQYPVYNQPHMASIAYR